MLSWVRDWVDVHCGGVRRKAQDYTWIGSAVIVRLCCTLALLCFCRFGGHEANKANAVNESNDAVASILGTLDRPYKAQ